jgi:hypothetical protein
MRYRAEERSRQASGSKTQKLCQMRSEDKRLATTGSKVKSHQGWGLSRLGTLDHRPGKH